MINNISARITSLLVFLVALAPGSSLAQAYILPTSSQVEATTPPETQFERDDMTLLGIDSDSDGVRDDAERFIGGAFASPTYSGALREDLYGVAYLITLAAKHHLNTNGSYDQPSAFYTNFKSAVLSASSSAPNEQAGENAVLEVISKMTNTKGRYVVYESQMLEEMDYRK